MANLLSTYSRLVAKASCVQRVIFVGQSQVVRVRRYALVTRELFGQPPTRLALAKPFLSTGMNSVYQPWFNHRMKSLMSKVLSRLIWATRRILKIAFWIYVAFQVQCGSPGEGLYRGLYQGLKFGWDSSCADAFKCEGEPARGWLGDAK